MTATISFFARTSNPADNSQFDSANAPNAVVPPASMALNDLVILRAGCQIGGSGRPLTIGQAGGQTWHAGTFNASSHNNQMFWCVFNGTWTANPSIASNVANGGLTVEMLVFRSSLTTPAWKISTAESDTLNANPGTPFDCTINGLTPNDASNLALAWWMSGSICTFALQTAGWTNPSGVAQVRNPAGSGGCTLSAAYLIQTTAAATGNVTNRELTGTGFGFWGNIIVFTDGTSSDVSFAAPPTVQTPTTDGFVCPYTPKVSGTVYGVALKKGSATPLPASVRTGSPTGFISRVSKACTANTADSQTVTGLTDVIVDLHWIVNNGSDSAVTSLLGQVKLPAAGRQYIALVPPLSATSPFPAVLAALSLPALAAGDYVDAVAMVGSYPVAITPQGDVEVDTGHDESRELVPVNFYDVSAGGFYFTGDSEIVINDQAPIFAGDPTQAFVWLLPKNGAASKDLGALPLMLDTEFDDVTYTETTAVLTGLGLAITDNVLAGNTPNADSITSVGIQGDDGFGGVTGVTGTLVIGNVTVPDCANMDESNALNAMRAAYIPCGPSLTVRSLKALGTVVSQTPAAEASVDPSATIAVLTLSGGSLDVVLSEFLDDATAVPASAIFYQGSAYDRTTGALYVAAWPGSGKVNYIGKLAHRPDGAMIINVGGTIANNSGGLGLTSRGEVVAVVNTPDLEVNGFPVRSDGTLCVSAVS